MDKLLDSILYAIRRSLIVEYGQDHLYFPNQMRVESNGIVRWLGYGELPLGWSQRRSVRRAFARRHKAATDRLVTLGLSAAKIRGEKL